MKNVFKLLILSILISSCSSNNSTTEYIKILVTKKEGLDNVVGKIITIKGEIKNTKIPTIIGVDISTKDAYKKFGDLKGKTGTASGILIKNVIKDANRYSTNRGNGTFYRLINPKNGFDAEVEILNTSD